MFVPMMIDLAYVYACRVHVFERNAGAFGIDEA